ncbi:AsmA family protein [Xanthomarina sp. F1114]|uniref:AsmA-like C-terminal region-containing protein n=1 Tax=Xanthomarina sp. F1114 TaxID=2996019 RepID=UPI00225DE2B2|nr:AsmA-like C-terminal region-containing protein [Xanthomarina sp. F1114]MCX7546741.1 AsmA family protein [Xanthomarina sp. F1114]
MKKILKITGITLLVLVLLLISIPFLFQSKIKEIVKRTINENLNAHVEFSDVSLSFIRSFPQAQVDVSDLVITNFEPFKDETLATAKTISLNMSVKELFKNADEGPVVINEIKLNEALVSLKTNKRGETNYDIAKESEDKLDSPEDTSKGFTLDIKDYAINNSALTYLDEGSNTTFYITEFNHSGKGTFSGDVSELDTKTSARVSLKIDSTEYLSNNDFKLDALIGLDLTNNKYTFKENKALINQLPIEFQGFVQMLEEGQEIDITFENPGSDFKDFLAIIPKTYSKDLDKVETSGNFKIKGIIKGNLTEETIPTLDINMVSTNASFKYPDLPKGIDNISINASVKNTTGLMDDTYVDLKTLNFKIDQDVFKSTAVIKNLTKNISVNAHVDGVLNLANLSKAYPIDLDNELTGILVANLNTNFDMDAIESNAYQRIKSDGNLSIKGFKFDSEDMVNPIEVSEAAIAFNPGIIKLTTFNASTGKSDIKANGVLHNFLGFIFSNKKLEGDFNVNSNAFYLSDFMEEKATENSENKTTSPSEAFKIPAFLDCKIHADAKIVYYDNLTLKDVKGDLYIKEEKAVLRNMSTNVFNGKLLLDGYVDTYPETPTFVMNLDMNQFDISQSFDGLEILQSLAPIASALQGKLNSNIAATGNLGNDFTPDLNSINGSAFFELQTTKIEPKNEALVNALNNALSFVDFSKLDLKDLKTNLTFENGMVNITPFDVHYKDIEINIKGSHSFTNTMDYNAVFQVPAKYLGSDINRLIGKIDDQAVNNISIPVSANITGTFNSPNVKTDLTSAVGNLTKQLIEIEKQKLINKGKNQILDLLDGMNSNQNQNTPKDSTETTTPASSPIKNILDDIIKGGNASPKDSTGNSKPKSIKDLFNYPNKNKSPKADSIN